MYADAVISAILQAEAIGGNIAKAIPLPALKMDRGHFKVSSHIFEWKTESTSLRSNV